MRQGTLRYHLVVIDNELFLVAHDFSLTTVNSRWGQPQISPVKCTWSEHLSAFARAISATTFLLRSKIESSSVLQYYGLHYNVGQVDKN